MLAMDVWCFSKSTIRVDLEKHQTRLHYWGNSLCNFEESPLQLWVFLLCTKQLQTVASRKYAHLLNVMITEKRIYDRYCEWLFPLLFQVEKRLDASDKIKNMDRSVGMIGERLLDVWLLQNRLKLKECFSINTERKDWKAW